MLFSWSLCVCVPVHVCILKQLEQIFIENYYADVAVSRT